MYHLKMLIDGTLEGSDLSLDVINPSTEEVFVQVPRASEQQLETAVAAARAAFPGWRATPIKERQRLLNVIADRLRDNAAEIAPYLTREQGKPLNAATMEVQFAEIFCRHFAQMELTSEVLHEDASQRVELHRNPLGVVAAIVPWNFPLLIAVYKLAPALLTGNTLVLKPAPSTPVTALILGELVSDILPRGVVNVIVDANDLGPRLAAHPGIAKISFTGSTATGKSVLASTTATLKRVTLELGGNDAAIVLDDVDPEFVAPLIFNTAFINSGQVCIAIKRLYVQDGVYDALCNELARLAATAVVGDGFDPKTQFGPVQNRKQYDKVVEYIGDARKHGKIIAGGDVPVGPGYFVPITIVRDITDGTRVVDEEPFGPILPIIRVHDEEDALSRANNSIFGLGGSVWSGDLDRAREVAARMQCGTVWINQHCAFGPHIPMPASKQSGIGVEWGEEGVREFTGLQVININKQTAIHPATHNVRSE